MGIDESDPLPFRSFFGGERIQTNNWCGYGCAKYSDFRKMSAPPQLEAEQFEISTFFLLVQMLKHGPWN